MLFIKFRDLKQNPLGRVEKYGKDINIALQHQEEAS